MPSLSGAHLPSYEAQNRALDFLSIKHACPKGLYLAPHPTDSNRWEGVLFVRHGIFKPAVLRFTLTFPSTYPHRAPDIAISTEIFHPLIRPLTTYTYTTQDTGADTVSANDDEHLPPGGFSLSHGFPQWYGRQQTVGEGSTRSPPHVVEVLFYLRNAFTSEALLDSVPYEAAANPGAWHAWQSYRARIGRASLPFSSSIGDKSASTRQQPGVARKPAEWNWDGVWEERVRKGVRASTSEQSIYRNAGMSDDLINFVKLDAEDLEQINIWRLSA